MDDWPSHFIFKKRASRAKQPPAEGTFAEGKVKRHSFVGDDPKKCDRCGTSFSNVVHK